MSYTALRVDENGVLLFDQHAARLGDSPADAEALRTFAREASPGVYVVTRSSSGLAIRPRGPSAIFEGMPIEWAISPYAEERGPHPKVPPPNPYVALRKPGIATLLTSSDGRELYESCAAGIVAWDGERLVLPPSDRPIVRSTALAALAEGAEAAGLTLVRTPLLRDSTWALGLINAVAGLVVPTTPGRSPFPAELRVRIAATFARATHR